MADSIPLEVDTTDPDNAILRRMPAANRVDPTRLPDATTAVKGAVPLASSAPPDIAASGSPGDSTAAAAGNHTHGHGNQAGGSLHQNAVPNGAAGFMSGEDKAALDGAVSGLASEVSARGAGDNALQIQLDAHVGFGGAEHPAVSETDSGFATPPDKLLLGDVQRLRELFPQFSTEAADDEQRPEILAVFGANRWRAGASTAGFAGVYFYGEMPASLSFTPPDLFASGSNFALYSPIGVPNAGSPNSNAPANTEAAINASMHWDDGIPIPPQALVGGAVLEIDLYGMLKIGRAGVLYLVLDPDGDVRIEYGGDNTTMAFERHKVVGAQSGVAIGAVGTADDDGTGDLRVTLPTHGLVDDVRVWVGAGDRTRGIMPDLVEAGFYFVKKLTNDTFKLSTTAVASPTYVAWNPTLVPPAMTVLESAELYVTRYTGSGSWKQIKFAFDLSSNTVNSDFQPCRLRVRGFADGRGVADTEDGVYWYAELDVLEVCDQIGPTSTTTIVATQGSTNGKRWAAGAPRSTPGKGWNGTTIVATGAPMLLASNDYDGSANKSYVSTAYDFGGQWDEILLSADIVTTHPMASITSSQLNTQATATILSVGGTPIGEVIELLNARRLLRYRPFSADVRIESGATVTFQTYKLVGSTWSAIGGASGSFVAGCVRIGPQLTQLAIRAAMSGAQDGVNVLDFRGGVARLVRDTRR